jgi:hypothetical protein
MNGLLMMEMEKATMRLLLSLESLDAVGNIDRHNIAAVGHNHVVDIRLVVMQCRGCPEMD